MSNYCCGLKLPPIIKIDLNNESMECSDKQSKIRVIAKF